MSVIEIASIQVRRGQEHQTGIPKLLPGEFGWAEDTENLYIGKSIAEGAVDEYNTRVLTEKDLHNVSVSAQPGVSTARSIPKSVVDFEVLSIPVTNHTQSLVIDYQLTNDYLSRTGTLLINITPTGYSTIQDSYNYSESVMPGTVPLPINFDSIVDPANTRVVKLLCTNESTNESILEYRIAPLV